MLWKRQPEVPASNVSIRLLSFDAKDALAGVLNGFYFLYPNIHSQQGRFESKTEDRLSVDQRKYL